MQLTIKGLRAERKAIDKKIKELIMGECSIKNNSDIAELKLKRLRLDYDLDKLIRT